MSFKPQVYLAQKMTGKSQRQLVEDALEAMRVFNQYGLRVWSPVIKEGVPLDDGPLPPSEVDRLHSLWTMDKEEGLGTSHVLYDMDGLLMSQGVSIERGYQRWYQWRPVIRRMPVDSPYSISHIEEDFIVHSHDQAALYITKRWPTRFSWIAWKLAHLLFGLPKHAWRQIKSLWL